MSHSLISTGTAILTSFEKEYKSRAGWCSECIESAVAELAGLQLCLLELGNTDLVCQWIGW